MTILDYINDLHKEYKTGRATEHSYRGYLQTLIKSLVHDVMVTNEPQRVKCGAPDYIITRRDIPIGYIEAKDIGARLDDKLYKEQFDRYRKSLNNLLITDYLDFWLYVDGELVKKVRIGEVAGNSIKALSENHGEFTNLIKNFCTHVGQTIKSSKKLAEMMAGKARMLSEVIEKALNSDEENQQNSSLKEQMLAFKQFLIHDITPKGFADVYAQTIAYGMFAARLHDPTLPTFSRQEAATLIPRSNPFLRNLFGYIAGIDVDDRIKWIVDSLVEVFLACNVEEIMRNYGKSTQMEDPIIHFYETFLTSYDAKLRKERGVWYTPKPVVNFMVRAVDDILKTEFNLRQGLADTSKTKVKVNLQETDKRYKDNIKTIELEVHKVQILDPATGTGTFLAEVVKHIHKKFDGQQGIWSQYVEQHLLPRLNGFELLMASYAMAHLKLDLLLTETGFKPTKEQRFRVYLTNSLEESHPDTGTLFASWLSTEANEANQIKRDTPVMVIIGNPPYSGESANKGEWIMNLMKDYKKEPGGKEKLKERNPKWINDDYVKFLRYGQYFIEKNGSGVLAFINPHGFLDNPTFRGMRWNLLKTYDKIYTIDLHGNSKKKEVTHDGTPDVNVFNIEQGVSINFFVKTGKKKGSELGKIFHAELLGKRELKFDFLSSNSVHTVNYKELPVLAPNYYFVVKNFESQKSYDKGFSISDLFEIGSVGIATANDSALIAFTEQDLIKNIPNSYSEKKISPKLIKPICYRPFDNRYIYYDTEIVERPRLKVMRHFLDGENIGLALCKQFKTGDNYVHVFISDQIIESSYVSNRTSEITTTYPLYTYPAIIGQQSLGHSINKAVNFNTKIIKNITKASGLTLDYQATKNSFSPIDLLDYIYSVLHSPNYREKYKEFLKIDFPKIPYPKDIKKFRKLVDLGKQLRLLHLMKANTTPKLITKYPIGGNNIVKNVKYLEHKVYINDTQYFDNVPQQAWEFYIGGYQPAQKWLKDRKDRQLSFDDILHYQKIIVALTETGRIMKEIDLINIVN